MMTSGWIKLLRALAVGSSALLLVSGAVMAQHEHTPGEPRPEAAQESPIPLNPAAGDEVGFVYQAFLSPLQEGGEEEDTPFFVPPQFRSTEPSVGRNERTSRGHAVIEFENDLSQATVYLAVENVDPADIVMLHLHCGLPGQLGPIIIDFSLLGDVQAYMEDGLLTVTVHNEDIVAVTEASDGGLIDGFTLGCPIVPSVPIEKVRTIAGMQIIAEAGELYFNLHTAGQVYFGDIRGQFSRVEVPAGE